MCLAPIVLFVYNRPWHTRQTIEALRINELAEQSDLIIYSDGPKDDQSLLKVKEVRKYLKAISGFKSVTIIEREKNWGLAPNIIDGVTDVVNRYGRIIVMEDDIVTSPAYLSFMNQALEHYQKTPNVWHVSGWNYRIDPDGLGDAFLWRAMNCWGWATWKDRWQYFENNPKTIIDEWSSEEKYRFDLEGSGVFWSQIEANAQCKIKTWAIFWYASIFKHDGLCLNPTVSYVDNIGHDGSGLHCDFKKKICTDMNMNKKPVLPKCYVENPLVVTRIKKAIRPPLLSIIKRKISSYVYK